MRNGLLIDYEWCTGCYSCVVACQEEHGFPSDQWGIRVHEDGLWQIGDDPHKWNWNKIAFPTDLCDLCQDRTSKGREPSCVHHCLAQVIQYGAIDELVKELDKKPKQFLVAPC